MDEIISATASDVLIPEHKERFGATDSKGIAGERFIG